ncbi:tektin family protein [candidate division KSB1 bacterium]|nr:tektin family protein [candidate division KSB1 bacterium]
MKHGKAGLTPPNFLTKWLKGKTGCVQRRVRRFLQPPAETISRFQGECGNGIWRSVVNVVRWMLLGVIVAGPSLQNLHSQDSRPVRIAEKTQPKTSAKPGQLGSSAQSVRAAEPAKALAPSRNEIVLPDIFITLPADTIAALKKQLEKAEQNLRLLERERSRLRKTLEQLEKRSFNRADPPAQRTTELLGRPSV